MFIFIDKNTNKITQTISANFGIEVKENELLQEVSEEFVNKYNTAQDYSLIYVDGIVMDINIIKTKEEWQSDQSQLEALTPSLDETEQAEFELKTINLLTELGVI